MTSRGQTGTPTVPVVLPQVVVHPHDDDKLTITANGQQIGGAPLRRAELGQALADLTERAGTPIRVEVHEPDGTRYADIITPPPAVDDHPTRPVEKRRRRRRGVEIAGGGFLPDETVLIAVIVRTETADHTGHATVRLDHRTAASSGAAGVLVFGAVSGTLLLAEPS